VTTTFPEAGTAPQEPVSRTRKAAGWKAKLCRRMGWKSKSDIAFAPLEQNQIESKNPSITELGLSANTSSQSVLIHLLTQDIVLLRSKGLLPKLLHIILEEINDKSKSDSFIRAIIVVQIIWIVIQTIACTFCSFEISQLEVAVIMFAICAIIIYGINWEKPKGV
jgi:predicted membrane protein